MIPELSMLQRTIFTPKNMEICDAQKDQEAEAYTGYNFSTQDERVKFRKAKITPKKIGLFVALWERASNGKTIPFHQDGPTDVYIFMAQYTDKRGFFIFSKQVLANHNILSTSTKEGKRGFRLYPPWDKPTSKQALASQQWQVKYFTEV